MKFIAVCLLWIVRLFKKYRVFIINGAFLQAVQPHLRKCFDAIALLEFATVNVGGDGKATPEKTGEVQVTNDILAMISPEGENVSLGKGLKGWLLFFRGIFFPLFKEWFKILKFKLLHVNDRSNWGITFARGVPKGSNTTRLYNVTRFKKLILIFYFNSFYGSFEFGW